MRKCTKKWKTKDGTKIRVCDMTDEHLGNTIRFLQRYGDRKRMDVVRGTAAVAGMVTADIAEYHADQQFDAACEADWSDYVPDIYWDMERDAERRGMEVS